jgi:lipoyl-dependent peroxiredoxin
MTDDEQADPARGKRLRPRPVVEPPTLSVLYSSSAIATGGVLDGRVRTLDGRLDIALAKPKALGGSGAGPGNDPDQLLAAAYSAIFLTALHLARSQDDPKLPSDTAVQATVGFGLRPDGGFGLEITLEIRLPGMQRAAAEGLLEKARHICSVCDATRQEVLRLKLA